MQNSDPARARTRTAKSGEQASALAIRDFKIWYGWVVVRRQIVKVASGDAMARVQVRLSRRSLLFTSHFNAFFGYLNSLVWR